MTADVAARAIASAREAEREGDVDGARRTLERAWRDGARAPEVASALAVLLGEAGSGGRALAWAARAVATGAPAPGDAESIVALAVAGDRADLARSWVDRWTRDGSLSDPLLDRLRERIDDGAAAPEGTAGPRIGDSDAARLLEAFRGRENVYARQWWNPDRARGGYAPVREPLTESVVRNHLLGNVTVGVYPIRLDGTVCFLAFDIDVGRETLDRVRGDPDRAREVRRGLDVAVRGLVNALDELGLPGLIEDSGQKGRHVWVLFDRPVPASGAHAFGRDIVHVLPALPQGLTLEFFPKQPRTSGGPGNLIKLPLGIHRTSGRWSRFLDRNGLPVEDGIAHLGAHPRATRFAWLGAVRAVADSRGRDPAPAAPAPEPPTPDGDDAPALPLPERAPVWTDADYDRAPEIARLFERCAVLGEIRRRAETTRVLDADEQVVLRHTLGHLSAGVLAANHVLSRCAEVPAASRLRSRLRGNPISCARVRTRVPEIAGRVGCACAFEHDHGEYPNPLLHVRGPLPVPDAPGRAGSDAPDDLGRRLGALFSRRTDLDREIDELRSRLAERMNASGTNRLEFEEGAFVLRDAGGAMPAIEWVARDADDAAEVS